MTRWGGTDPLTPGPAVQTRHPGLVPGSTTLHALQTLHAQNGGPRQKAGVT
ncbi:hypothetical protein GCM10008023_14570 [Sphingomonas glacialis]|uniref:Uncharacterized protein n=1 Tax=Sphingomonas glacialis TaxID=658225 RepID=A0ABQ3LK79_9SPHN|nr:hypothetical protein GCM10008023_14570 [Sphingomonas glacialis]